VAGLEDASVPAEDGLIGHGWGAVIKVLKTNAADAPLNAELACAPGESGYVWLNTPALMKGYFRRDDLTARAVVDGWFMTGDIGFLDETGWLVLRGGKRDDGSLAASRIGVKECTRVLQENLARRRAPRVPPSSPA